MNELIKFIGDIMAEQNNKIGTTIWEIVHFSM